MAIRYKSDLGGRGSAKSENLNAMIEAEAARMVERQARKTRKMDRTAQAVEMDDVAAGRMLVSLRLDPSVVAFFKALGPGWTGKINDVLVKLVKEGADRWLNK